MATVIRQITCITLSCYKDDVAGIYFAKVLSEAGVQSIKIPTYKHRLINQIYQPFVLCQVEVVKRAKHWMLNEVFRQEKLIETANYTEIENVSKGLNSLNKMLVDGYEGDLFNKLIIYLNDKKIDFAFNLDSFQNFLFTELGFAKRLNDRELDNKKTVQGNINEGSFGNDLRF
jgi:hypothetical protein